jgi:hypothetical protein
MVANYDPAVRKYARTMSRPAVHAPRREGDEMACKCGKRWPVGEDHP